MKKIDYNGNDQAVVEEDGDLCYCQGGTQKCPLQGKCQLEGEVFIYLQGRITRHTLSLIN